MSAQPHDRVHPVLAYARSVGEVPDVATWTMSPEEHKSSLVALARAQAQLTALYTSSDQSSD